MNSDIVQKLASGWREAGVEAGDMLLLHTNLSRILRRVKALGGLPSPETVLASFLCALGPEGTLLLPLFNFDFARGVPFDLDTTPSQMGVLTELGRHWPGAVRTGHPIYSFAALGGRVDPLRDVKNFSGYGADSPFGILHRLNGKIGVLDLPDQNSVTFYHYIEETLEVPYRYHKTFTAPYRGADGLETIETFGLFVRDIDAGVVTRVNPMGERLWDRGLYRGSRPKEGHGLRVISSQALFDEVSVVIKSGGAKGLLYDIE